MQNIQSFFDFVTLQTQTTVFCWSCVCICVFGSVVKSHMAKSRNPVEIFQAAVLQTQEHLLSLLLF